jgi:branched-subunit amino acid aminotransferase/4-amino-4-deoxychorismate lyase
MSFQKSHPWVHLDGQWLREHEAMIPVENRGLMYGDGLFETILYSQGRLILIQSHLKRFFLGLKLLKLNLSLSSEHLIDLLNEGVEKNDLSKAEVVIRMQCWREGGRGYAATTSKAHYYISFTPLKQHSKSIKEGIALYQSSYTTMPKRVGEHSLKSSNALSYVLAASEAVDQGYDDALLLSPDGYIAECSNANIFWIRSNQLFTPSRACHILEGTRRSALIEKIRLSGYQLLEGEYTTAELYRSDLVFLVNSIRGLRPVSTLNETELSISDDQLVRLSNIYQEAIRN